MSPGPKYLSGQQPVAMAMAMALSPGLLPSSVPPLVPFHGGLESEARTRARLGTTGGTETTVPLLCPASLSLLFRNRVPKEASGSYPLSMCLWTCLGLPGAEGLPGGHAPRPPLLRLSRSSTLSHASQRLRRGTRQVPASCASLGSLFSAPQPMVVLDTEQGSLKGTAAFRHKLRSSAELPVLRQRPRRDRAAPWSQIPVPGFTHSPTSRLLEGIRGPRTSMTVWGQALSRHRCLGYNSYL